LSVKRLPGKDPVSCQASHKAVGLRCLASGCVRLHGDHCLAGDATDSENCLPARTPATSLLDA
jgi:hypothetical protein